MKNKIQKFELWLGGVVLILMVLVVVLQVIFRYFSHPLSWPEEVARWTMIWVTFAGASYAFKNGGLIRVEFFVHKFFKPGAQKVINIIDMVLLAVTFGYLFYSSVLYMMLTIKKHQMYNVTQMPYAAVAAALALSGVLCVIFSAKQIIDIARISKNGADGKEEAK